MIGRTLLHYKIVEKLGAGGMGEVYRAHDNTLGRDVALKILPEDLAADDDRRMRFEREARVVASLNHPNIVTIHSIQQAEGLHFITMELVEGSTLSEIIPEKGLSLDRFIELAVPMADAVSTAHASGVAHRDLKPANVMLDSAGRVKILDFGLAKLFESDIEGADTVAGPDSDTAEGRILGTVAYMSPEQAEGKTLDHRSDVFSLGIIMYEMLTGKRPFSGDTNISTISSILKDEPDSVTDIREALPRHLGRIVNRCLAKKPDRRYQSALDIRNELEDLRKEVDSGEVEMSTASGIHPAPPKKRSLRPFLMGGVSLIVLALAVLLGPKLLERGSGGGTETAQVEETPSVAVLPFVNVGGNPENEYFSDGLSEELINRLSKVSGLRVAARTSSFHFKGHTGAMSEIGEKLGVLTILEGSVRRAGDRVRVSASLVKAADGFEMWSETYDRTLDDIFGIQEEIATQVVGALEITLLGEDAARIAAQPTENIEAYEAYLVGTQRLTLRHTDALTEAAGYFQRAVDLDPKFAEAYANLALSYVLLNDYGGMDRAEALRLAEPLVDKALELDPRSGESWAITGQVRGLRADFEGSIEAYQRANELAPNYAYGFMWHALLMRARDKQEAWRLLEKAIELDPMLSVAHTNAGFWLQADGKPREAIRRFQHVIEINPNFAVAYRGMADTYEWGLGDPDEALVWYGKAVETDPRNLDLLLAQGRAQARFGKTDAALATYRKALDIDPGFAPGYEAISDLHQNQGRYDEAVRWKRRALERDPENLGLMIDMVFLSLRLDDERAARRWSEEIKRAHPNNPFNRVGDALVGFSRGEYEEAGAIIEEFSRMMPEEFIEQMASMDLLAGNAEASLARWKSGHPELFEPDVVINGGNLHETVNMCFSLRAAGQQERLDVLLTRVEAFLRGLSQERRDASFTMQTVHVHILRNDLDAAIAEYRRLVDEGKVGFWWERGDPSYQALSKHPGFDAVMEASRERIAPQRERANEEGLFTP